MFAKYQGLSSLLPSGYQEALMQPGKNIAAGISKAGDSIADAVVKYQAIRERDAIIRGKVEAVVKSKGEQGDAWLSTQSEETQKLLKKFSEGKESHDDLLKLGSYLDASETMETKAREEQFRKTQQQAADLQLQVAQRAEADRVAMNSAYTAGISAPGASSTETVRAPISPEQANVEISRYYSGESNTQPSAGVDISALTKYNEQKAMFNAEQAQPPMVRDNPAYAKDNLTYETQKAALAQDVARYSGELEAARKLNGDSKPVTVQMPAVSGEFSDYVPAPYTESSLAVAKRVAAATEARKVAEAGVAEAQAKLAALTAPQKLIPAEKTLTAPADPGLTAEAGTVTTQTPATPEQQFSAALASVRAGGVPVSPQVVTALKSAFNVTDMNVVKKDGYDVVMVNGKAEHIDVTGGKVMSGAEAAALEARAIQPESGGGYVGLAPTADEAKEFRALVATSSEGVSGIKELVNIAKNSGSKTDLKVRARAAVLRASALGSLRVSIVGPGAVSETEWGILNTVIADPTKVLSFNSSNISALETMAGKIESHLAAKAKSIGLRRADDMSSNSTGGASYIRVNGKLVKQ